MLSLSNLYIFMQFIIFFSIFIIIKLRIFYLFELMTLNFLLID
jgi:hypothetical protein